MGTYVVGEMLLDVVEALVDDIGRGLRVSVSAAIKSQSQDGTYAIEVFHGGSTVIVGAGSVRAVLFLQ